VKELLSAGSIIQLAQVSPSAKGIPHNRVLYRVTAFFEGSVNVGKIKEGIALYLFRSLSLEEKYSFIG
jgi:hypothetical protein